MTVQPDDPGPMKGEDDFEESGVWIWILSIMAALGLVGIVTYCAMKMPLGEYATHQMTE